MTLQEFLKCYEELEESYIYGIEFPTYVDDDGFRLTKGTYRGATVKKIKFRPVYMSGLGSLYYLTEKEAQDFIDMMNKMSAIDDSF